MSPAAKLCGFLLLLALVFIGAYAAGAHLGPVTVGTAGPSAPGPAGSPVPANSANPASPGTGGSMNMSGP